MLKLIESEFRKIKRQKFILVTVIAACIFPIPLSAIIVHSKLSFETLYMFVIEFGFLLMLPIVMGCIATLLFHMETDTGANKTLAIIPVSKGKLLLSKLTLLFVLAIFYSISAIGATIVGGVISGSVAEIGSKLFFAALFGVLITIGMVPILIIIVGFQKNFIMPIFCTVAYTLISFICSVSMTKVPLPFVWIFRYMIPIITTNASIIDTNQKVQEWILSFESCVIYLTLVGSVGLVISYIIYKRKG
ncbi:ABC transporter permease [Dorea longicatena]|uniref:ABC transporter permease n=1 Tax=Dorea longicatena TaxID=88431 RepID=UPI000420288F|nr:ABC transporter permease [Dorea longicatena]